VHESVTQSNSNFQTVLAVQLLSQRTNLLCHPEHKPQEHHQLQKQHQKIPISLHHRFLNYFFLKNEVKIVLRNIYFSMSGKMVFTPDIFSVGGKMVFPVKTVFKHIENGFRKTKRFSSLGKLFSLNKKVFTETLFVFNFE